MQRGLQIRHPKASVFGDSGSELIAVALLLTLALSGLDAHLLVVLLQGGQILASLRKLTLLHAFTDIPVHKRALAVHQVELVVDPRENLRDRRGVADHAACTHDLGQVATAAFTSFGTTSPRYIMQQAMYLPWRGSHFTNIAEGSKTDIVIPM